MNVIRILHSLVVVVVVMLTTSCGSTQTYPGERLPQARVARINVLTTHRHFLYNLNIIVKAVDGVNIGKADMTYEVLPGEHTLYVICQSWYHVLAAPVMASKQFTVVPGNFLTFRAEAGRRYTMNGEDIDEVFYIWLEDVETGSVVAGRKPEPSIEH